MHLFRIDGDILATTSKPAVKRTTRASKDLSQNDLAYSRLKAALTTMQYKPGEYLNTALLMTELKLGRTPINHALHRLEGEGLVQIIPRKGVVVAALSLDEALALTEVRIANESLCLKLAAKSISDTEIEKLRAVSAKLEGAIERRDLSSILGHDREFHEAIATASRNPILMDILAVLHARSQRFWAMSLSSPGHLQEVLTEHRRIVDALARHDGDAAALEVQGHIESFRSSLLRRTGAISA